MIAYVCIFCQKGHLVPASVSGEYAKHFRCGNCGIVLFQAGDELMECVDPKQHLKVA